MKMCRVKLETKETVIQLPETNDDYKAKEEIIKVLNLPQELQDNPDIMVNYIDIWDN